MSEPFIGEVQIFGFPFAPANWAYANGAQLAIRQYSTLFSLFGTQFGGDGVTTFALPNLASRQVCGSGQSPGNSNRSLGQTFGTPSVSLQLSEMPAHNHTLSTYATESEGQLVGIPTTSTAIGDTTSNLNPFGAPGSGTTTMNPNAIGASGSGAAHENRQPFLALNYCVALFGDYPYFP